MLTSNEALAPGEIRISPANTPFRSGRSRTTGMTSAPPDQVADDLKKLVEVCRRSDLVGRLLVPEVFQGVDRDGRNVVLREDLHQSLVEVRPAAVPRDEQQDGARPLDQPEHQGQVQSMQIPL